MIHRVATSEAYRCSPTAIRRDWAFRDFLHAHVVLDLFEAKRQQAEEQAEVQRHMNAWGRHG
ncbi:MAG: hypothetical protein AAGA48_27585 [Myxococcota bacterium]